MLQMHAVGDEHSLVAVGEVPWVTVKIDVPRECGGSTRGYSELW